MCNYALGVVSRSNLAVGSGYDIVIALFKVCPSGCALPASAMENGLPQVEENVLVPEKGSSQDIVHVALGDPPGATAVYVHVCSSPVQVSDAALTVNVSTDLPLL
mmetsp:Transcript_4405/g.6569  ORF Transcript_4405/g.6569 Transcript_4405/m.6569 type:complete len:105 (+) Transcript_4405:41-355(+)